VPSFRDFGGGKHGFEIAVYNTANRQMAVTRIAVRVDMPTPSALAPAVGRESLPVVIEPKELARL